MTILRHGCRGCRQAGAAWDLAAPRRRAPTRVWVQIPHRGEAADKRQRPDRFRRLDGALLVPQTQAIVRPSARKWILPAGQIPTATTRSQAALRTTSSHSRRGPPRGYYPGRDRRGRWLRRGQDSALRLPPGLPQRGCHSQSYPGSPFHGLRATPPVTSSPRSWPASGTRFSNASTTGYSRLSRAIFARQVSASGTVRCCPF